MIYFKSTQQRRTKNNFSLEEKMAMIQEYLTTDVSMSEMTRKYHIGHSSIPRWMANFGIPMPERVLPSNVMVQQNEKQTSAITVESLESQLKSLQAELEREKLRNLALNTMIDVAEEELHIDIRKKAGAKQ